jgi:amino acid transporter
MKTLICVVIYALGSIATYRTIRKADRLHSNRLPPTADDVVLWILIATLGSWFSFLMSLFILWDYTHQKYRKHEDRQRENRN